MRGSSLLGCQTARDESGTISQLRNVEPDLNEYAVDDSLVSAMAGYREFLNATPNHAMAPEAMRRLADLEIEKEYGVMGKSASVVALPLPESDARGDAPVAISAHKAAVSTAPARESDKAFEDRATAETALLDADELDLAELPESVKEFDLSGPRQAIKTYKKILNDYPWYERNDQVLYQMARAYDELGLSDQAMGVIDRLIAEYPRSKYLDEVYFRRGEYFFVRRKYRDAETAYQAVATMGESSSFYELSLYKLGWSLYKQEFYEEALHQVLRVARLQSSDRLRLRREARRGRGAPDRRYVAGRQSESVQPGRSRGDRRVLRDQRKSRLRRSRLPLFRASST